VHFAVRQIAGEARASVADQGEGMMPEQLRQLFWPFARLEHEGKRGMAGAGLGLYICKAIVEAHGGRIWAEGEPGRGSTFHVALPLPPPNA
jgi:signal transduction histidine kinase